VVPSTFALRLISQEVASLIGRVEMVRPFSLNETMVAAAVPAARTLHQIDVYLLRGRRRLLTLARRFLHWLQTEKAERSSLEAVNRQYVFLRLRVNTVLTELDVFADAISQRSEADTGVWLAGLDALARDALALPRARYRVPPLLCYLDRGIGAAIRRARTRLPGGGENPVAIVRVPRERMVGLGIASSLVHEAGHQGAALIDLVPTLRRAMEPMVRLHAPAPGHAWGHWYRWISEIVADLWSVARLGVASTLGLMNVVSLPRVFVFRANLDDPHPTPWIRVLLSVEMGRQLYPHLHWQRVLELWRGLYPLRLDVGDARSVGALAEQVPELVHWMLRQTVTAPDQALSHFMRDPELAAERLESHVERWARAPRHLNQLKPCQAFAVAGYCRIARGRTPLAEIPLFSSLLTRWALAA
jgi:hypothetical protein